ncbi:hypothetical protein [Terriglobus sp.]|uniref:hypothetical protein n=1 Tax=Terriglobus sp. TaxID=1889013 RepID=UPI003AFF9C59
MKVRQICRLSFIAAVLLVCSRARAQQTGPPAYVPIPAAPIASDGPKAEPEVAVPAGDLHFRVRLLDGRSSLPMKNARVRVWYDEQGSAGYLLTTDLHGEALLPAPTVTPVRVLVVPDGLYDCRKLSEREAMPGYNLQQIAGKGMVTEDRCDAGARAVAHPGELTLFARAPRWYEKLNAGAGR